MNATPRNPQATGPLSVPVTIDDVKQRTDFAFTRCEYFTIQCDTPSPDWVLGLQNRQIPFMMLGLSGIIFQPSLEEPYFTSPHQIETLFDGIEENEAVYVDTADLWLPTALVRKVVPRGRDQMRGVTIRIYDQFFQEAVAFRNGTIDQTRFEGVAHELERTVTYIPEEDKAFHQWHRLQLGSAIDAYPKNRELALHWNDLEQGPTDEGRMS